MQQPTIEDVEALHKKYAPTNSVYAQVHGHCQIVWEIAEQLIGKSKIHVDTKLVHIGCLLHDIGVYTFFDSQGNYQSNMRYIEHGIRGRDLLQQEGYPESLCRFASHHTGVGLTKDDIIDQKLPLPLGDYIPTTIEERLVAYADKFHSKTLPSSFLNSYEWYKHFVAKFGPDKAAQFEEMAHEFGIPDLAPLAEKYHLTIRVSESTE